MIAAARHELARTRLERSPEMVLADAGYCHCSEAPGHPLCGPLVGVLVLHAAVSRLGRTVRRR